MSDPITFPAETAMLNMMAAACAALLLQVAANLGLFWALLPVLRTEALDRPAALGFASYALGHAPVPTGAVRNRSSFVAKGSRKTNLDRIDFERINGEALVRLEFLLPRWLPGGRIEAGREYVVRNPLRNDSRPGSFKINLHTGAWADFATGDRGRDPISLVAYLNGLRQGEAARQLAGYLGVKL